MTAGEGRNPGVEAFGRWLLRERELRGLAREEVARATKLAPAVIEALESGDAARMPPRAYVVGYLRSFAAAVGLDPDQAVLRWQELEGVSGPGPEAPARARPRRGRAVLVAVLVAALVAALVALAAARRGAQGASERSRRPAERGSYLQPDAEPGRP